MSERLMQLRSWWRRHWWPSRIRQLQRERADWQRWTRFAEMKLMQANRLLDVSFGLIHDAYDGHWRLASERWEDSAKLWRSEYQDYMDGKGAGE